MSNANEPANRIEAFALSGIFTLVSFALLALLGAATKSAPAGSGWWTAPATAPALALTVLSAANAITLWIKFSAIQSNPLTPNEWAKFVARAKQLLRPLEFLAYFAAYLLSLRFIGYGPATLIFVLGLMVRVRLCSAKWLLTGAVTCAALILIFRVGLGVWMPAPDLYNLLPGSLRSAFIRWF